MGEQRFCVDPVSHSQNRQMVLNCVQSNVEMLRAEVLLYGQDAPGTGAQGGSGDLKELGGGVLCLAPERADPTLLRETRRVPIYTRISTAQELPRSWRELSAPHLLALIRRTPLSLQQRLKPGERGGPPTRAHMSELLSEWERQAAKQHASSSSSHASAADGSSRRVRVRPASSDPIGVALVSVCSCCLSHCLCVAERVLIRIMLCMLCMVMMRLMPKPLPKPYTLTLCMVMMCCMLRRLDPSVSSFLPFIYNVLIRVTTCAWRHVFVRVLICVDACVLLFRAFSHLVPLCILLPLTHSHPPAPSPFAQRGQVRASHVLDSLVVELARAGAGSNRPLKLAHVWQSRFTGGAGAK